MLELDNAVTANFAKVMTSYIGRCKHLGKADPVYTFETVLKKDGIPVSKVITDSEKTQILPVGEKEKK